MASRPHDIPDGGYTINTVKDLQKLDEAAIKRRLRAPADDLFTALKSNFLGNLIIGISDAIKGVSTVPSLFSPIRKAMAPIKDGQLALNARTDLLSPLLDYGAAYMESRSGLVNRGIMPFNRQVGPMTGCRLENNGIRLLDKGLWNIYATICASWTFIVASEVTWRIIVKDPRGNLYAEFRYTIATASATTMSNPTAVVVPEPGYLVQVEIIDNTALREVVGGSAWNRLIVQHISRETNIGSSGAGIT